MVTETKEGAALALPPSDSIDAALGVTRATLADEWHKANPTTADEVAAFYTTAQGIGDDLNVWHAHPTRQEWTRMLVHVAKESGAKTVVDIGAGMGHDLWAIKAALPDVDLFGVEPNEPARRHLFAADIACAAMVHDAPIETADLLICIDVLEHVPDPEDYLGSIARAAKVGCLLFETTATHDTGTPLHLKANRGWHPGRVLERNGWEMVDHGPDGRVRVWRKMAETGRQRASLLLCAYRSVSAETMAAILGLCAGSQIGWRLRQKNGDALIARSRSIIVTKWWQETSDDVLLMLDDDVVFSPSDADRLTELCRGGYDIVCGAYPVHDGGHLACKTLPGTSVIDFGPGNPPLEIGCAATGFMAVHRRVIDAMVQTMPLCHGNQPWSFYPLFQCLIAENEAAGGYEWMSEDYGFSEMARQLGFKVYLDPQTILTHMGQAGLSVRNMTAMHAALKGA